MSVTHEKKQEQDWPKLAIELVKGGVLAVAVSVAIVAGAAWLITAGLLGKAAEESYVIAACVLGAFLGGLYAVGRCKRGRLLMGVGTGAAELLLLLMVGTLFLGGVTGVGGIRTVGIGCLCGGILAGVLPALRPGRNRKR